MWSLFYYYYYLYFLFFSDQLWNVHSRRARRHLKTVTHCRGFGLTPRHTTCLLLFPVPWQYIVLCSLRQKCDLFLFFSSLSLPRQRKMAKGHCATWFTYLSPAPGHYRPRRNGTSSVFFFFLSLHTRGHADRSPSWTHRGFTERERERDIIGLGMEA